ncbi:MAG: hypothetical protein KIT09_27670 [Bryobacteraceae bacterium]|nr:hypothetical protein [Bryobacteraceae bacterium]
MEQEHEAREAGGPKDGTLRTVIQEAIQEFIAAQRAKDEPAYKTELSEERGRREQLERRLNELIQENERSKRVAEEAERSSAIRSELQRLGVTKVDLGFRAVKDDIHRSKDGRLVARTDDGDVSMQEYLTRFTRENPELLPARIPGGSGATGSHPNAAQGGRIDLAQIRPGMDRKELDQIRREIAQAITHSFRGE